VEFLDTMPEDRAILSVLCNNIALEHIDTKIEKHKLIKSKPYMKKQNRTGDIAQWQCWYAHYRVKKTTD
jgi:hypothetical protein